MIPTFFLLFHNSLTFYFIILSNYTIFQRKIKV
nr:MAG TPA: hypothetical protein [Caudoviricetes sp.]